jgi:tRNA A-37 threonylcarbamoyl transferase component Bud32
VKPEFNIGWTKVQGIWKLRVATPFTLLGSDKSSKKFEIGLFVGNIHNGTLCHFDLTKDRTAIRLKDLVPLVEDDLNYIMISASIILP